MSEIGQSATAIRITLKRPGHKQVSYALTMPPFPEIGDTVKLNDGYEWEVVKREPTEVLMRIPRDQMAGEGNDAA
jgi:hypothetical protein